MNTTEHWCLINQNQNQRRQSPVLNLNICVFIYLRIALFYFYFFEMCWTPWLVFYSKCVSSALLAAGSAECCVVVKNSVEKNDLWSKYNVVQYVKHMMAKIIVSFVYHRYVSGESFVFFTLTCFSGMLLCSSAIKRKCNIFFLYR